MSALFELAQREQRAGRAFALYAGRPGRSVDRLALGLQPVLRLSTDARMTDELRHTRMMSLRSAASAAFADGAAGLVVKVAHEGASLFDRIATQAAWAETPGIELWAAEQVMTAPPLSWNALPSSLSSGRELSGGGLSGRNFDAASLQELRAWHRAAVETIREQIAAGEVYQACLTFPLWLEPIAGTGELFAWLMGHHPVDFGAWVSVPGSELVSCSPELLFSLNGRELVTRPMKGTRRLPTDLTAERVAVVLEELQRAAKDRAENVMIADLLRNDLGRVCEPGSVRAARLWEVERYASVAQMTSTIEGRLRDGCDVWDALAAIFPPGSMTGAPKIAACELLQRLERAPRGLYGGTLGWIEPTGDACFSVLIRSLQQRGELARWDVGGGIVHDSSADEEWREAWAKIAVLEPLWDHAPAEA